MYTIHEDCCRERIWDALKFGYTNCLVKLVPRPSIHHQFTNLYFRWYELKDKYHCYANLMDLGIMERALEHPVVGAVLLEIRYRKLIPVGEREFQTTDEGLVSGMQTPLSVPSRRSLSLPSLLPSRIQSGVSLVISDTRSLYEETAESLDSRTEPAELDDFQEAQNEVAASKELHTTLRLISGWIFAHEDHSVIQNILKGFASFGQGIEVGRFALSIAFLILQRFYRAQPVLFSNNIVLKKQHLEIPRIIYRYAYAAHGWAAMYFFGKRSEIFSDAVSSDANYRAVMEYLQLEHDEMLICDLDEHRLFRPNFFVAIDRRLSAVILSIRGTMSLRDSLTDLSFEYMEWHGGIAHSGMVAAARWFMENVAKQLPLFATEYQMRRIILTGHSLGGATAALTTIMLTEELKKNDKWPTIEGKPLDIHCHSFGTPAVLSEELAKKYTDLIDSYIVGDDIVPRLSYGTMIDLQILMVYAAEIGRAGDLLVGNMEDTELFRKLEKCRQSIQSGQKVVNMKLHIPGRVHHILTIKAPNDRRYTVIDTCTSERFLEMALRKNMLRDHMPDRYERAFEDAYVTYLMHDLEERQATTRHSTSSMREKMRSVVEFVNDDGGGTMQTEGLLFPRPTDGSDEDDE